ncbi:MAG: thiamine-phosphate kinase [bacterium]
MKLEEVGEFGLIERIKQIVHQSFGKLVVGIDDDAAVFESSPGFLTVVSTDAFIETVHFDLSYFSFYQLGWRVLAASLSDIAAMAGVPKVAVFSIGLPASIEVESVEQFYRGAKALADRFETAIIGGDTTASPGKLFISITVIGEVEEEKVTRRSGARPGDGVFLTGVAGVSHAGLLALRSQKAGDRAAFRGVEERHLLPLPRVYEARCLVERFPIHAMIDVSDGVACEIHHICAHSRVGARLVVDRIPIDSGAEEVASLMSQNALDYALYGGEDFELLFTAPAQLGDEIRERMSARFDLACTCIGEITTQSEGICLEDASGRKRELGKKGYDHFGKTSSSSSS